MSGAKMFDTRKKTAQTAAPIFVSKKDSSTASPTAYPARSAGHNFGEMQVTPEQAPVAESCPLQSAPSRCPFGGACHLCPPRIQAKLDIGKPGDRYEQEADRVAEYLIKLPERSFGRQATRLSSRESANRHAVNRSSPLTDIPAVVRDALQSPGRSLDESSRDFFESRLGYDFSHVRMHTGINAAKSASALGARAYTAGRDIVFGMGEFAPTSARGRKLLAHELMHVVQQGANPQRDTFALSLLQTGPMIQCQRFRDCTPAITGTTGVRTQAEIDEAIRSALAAARLAVTDAINAINRIVGGTATAAQRTAFMVHFGALTAARRNAVLTRYTRIQTRLADERLFICNTAGSAYCRHGWCAYADCPGPGRVTHLCPPFIQSDRPCGVTRGEVIIEEAAHAVGACNNLAVGAGGYPSPNGQNNGPSYAYFAQEMRTLAFVRPSLKPPPPERPARRSLVEDVISAQERRMRERVIESAEGL